MTDWQTRRGVKRDGARCNSAAQIAGLCRRHYPKPALPANDKPRERIKTVAQFISMRRVPFSIAMLIVFGSTAYA